MAPWLANHTASGEGDPVHSRGTQGLGRRHVRTPIVSWADLTNRPGWLTIHALHVPLQSLQNVSFLARRQQHMAFNASTELEAPANPGGVSAGLAAFQNEDYWYFLGVRRIPV